MQCETKRLRTRFLIHTLEYEVFPIIMFVCGRYAVFPPPLRECALFRKLVL